MVIMIAAAAENNALGKDNDMIWHLPDDFRRFKALTTGHHIIMGRKTFESLPGLLPGRTHIIITNRKDYRPENCIVADSLKAALGKTPKDEDVFIIGGGQIFEAGMAIADKIELTRVHAVFDADTFFPTIDTGHWKLVSEVFHPADEKHRYAFTFETFVKK